MKLGIEKTAMIRLRAGISYALTEAMDEGHCGLPTDQLIPLAEELLEAPKELILTALELERSEGAVIAEKVGDTACMFMAGLYRAEQAIAERLIRIVSGRLPWASLLAGTISSLHVYRDRRVEDCHEWYVCLAPNGRRRNSPRLVPRDVRRRPDSPLTPAEIERRRQAIANDCCRRGRRHERCEPQASAATA